MWHLSVRVVVVALLVAPGCFINGNGMAQGEVSDNGNGNGNGNGSGNGSGNDVGESRPPSGPLQQGTYDIVSAGVGAIGPSQMVVGDGRVNGFVVLPGQGSSDRHLPSCVRVVDRRDFELSVQDGDAFGSFTTVVEWRGTGCPAKETNVTQVTGTGTGAGNDFSGQWMVFGVDQDGPVLVRITAAGDSIAAESSRKELTFVARKR